MPKYLPTKISLSEHPLPAWYNDAKLGVLVTWGPYSVPGWAPLENIIPGSANPLQGSEWYWNSLKIPGSPVQKYHKAEFGSKFLYTELADRFDKAIRKWNPSEWAELFQKSGIKYALITARNHDGYSLWPSEASRADKMKFQSTRDIVGDFIFAIKQCNIEAGVYYFGGLDSAWIEPPLTSLKEMKTGIPSGQDYADYVAKQWQELIDRYSPAVIWNDFSYPKLASSEKLLAYYYNQHPLGVINDRFGPVNPGGFGVKSHFDFQSVVGVQPTKLTTQKWECLVPLGSSFGYNQNEKDDDLISTENLVHIFIDVVSKNGNLLINIAPTANGKIPDIQKERLEGLGKWLEVNGEAIYGTLPCFKAESMTAEGIPVRCTRKDRFLYLFIMGQTLNHEIVLLDTHFPNAALVEMLGYHGKLGWERQERNIRVQLPPKRYPLPAYVLKVDLGVALPTNAKEVRSLIKIDLTKKPRTILDWFRKKKTSDEKK
jgi:alpha-L-fucosidase